MNTVEVLKAARAKIEKPEHWTTEYYARNADGHKTHAHSPDAVCFCTLGAVKNVSGDSIPKVTRAVFYLAKAINSRSIVDYNDSHSHEEVLVLFDKAIQLAEKAYK